MRTPDIEKQRKRLMFGLGILSIPGHMNVTEVEEVQPDEYVYILPLIVILGLSGNVISLVTIFHSRLRHVVGVTVLISSTNSSKEIRKVLLGEVRVSQSANM
ncbi:unnamed protein product [Haemonchus placei]|uniref:G_PROTEIN_RECEP_F1_2 domain-containing protein n=1 Tax=Haemonchus placei TaxID=6290 RepID=A0A158QRU2_HAEPC|nr:unnamed protein product [Haemonchus placei]